MAQQARDEAGNIWEVDAQGNPVRLVQAAGQAQRQQGITVRPTDPYRPRAEARADEDQDIQRRNLQLSEGSSVRSAASDRIDNPQKLRREYAALPEVKEYKVSTQEALKALNTANNAQGDISLVYAYAKAQDPGSVVRDQEANMVVNSQPWFQTAVQKLKTQWGLGEGGSFTPQTRARLREEILRVASTRKPLYEARRAELADVARANGINPEEVIGRDDTQINAPQFRAYAERYGDDNGVIAGLLGSEPIQKAIPRPQQMVPAGQGATQAATPVPAELEDAHQAYLAQNWGRLDPQDYAAFRINLDRQYGFGSDPEKYAASAADLNQYAARGGRPETQTVPAIQRNLSQFDQVRNNLLSDEYGVGAGVASALNAGGFGIPSLFAREQTAALRDEYPVSTFFGDIGGGLVGTGLAGGALRQAAGRLGDTAVARALASPLAADLLYGAGYGATQADDPLYGAAGGAGAALLGNRIGRTIGRAFPSITGVGGAIREADRAVPTSAQLRDQASQAYTAAERAGLTATPDETFALADRFGDILSREGVMSPTGRLSEVSPKVREAYKLVEDYAGAPMTPQQIQTVRKVVGDGLDSQEAAERRISRLLLNNFDEWTDATNPQLASGLAEARGIASRYLQGDKIARARELADVRAGQFSNSGPANALRTDFRQLDRAVANGSESFAPAVEEAIANVARGDPVNNALRAVGRFAPTGPVSAIPTLLAASGGGAAAGPAGAIGGLGLGALSLGARQLSQGLTERSAQVAENLAYGGPEYQRVLNALIDTAGARGGHLGASAGVEGERALISALGY